MNAWQARRDLVGRYKALLGGGGIKRRGCEDCGSLEHGSFVGMD